MSQAGYVGCIGCGRMFKEYDIAEQAAMLAHSCNDSDEKIDIMVASYRSLQVKNGI